MEKKIKNLKTSYLLIKKAYNYLVYVERSSKKSSLPSQIEDSISDILDLLDVILDRIESKIH